MPRSRILFLLGIVVLTGCRPHRPSRCRLPRTTQLTGPQARKVRIKHDPAVQKCYLELTGIACKFCARAALECLERVPGVLLAEYICQSSTTAKRELNLSAQLAVPEVTSMLELAYTDTQLGRPAGSSGAAHAHRATQQINNFPGYVTLYYQSPENSDLPIAQIKQALAAEGFGVRRVTLPPAAETPAA